MNSKITSLPALPYWVGAALLLWLFLQLGGGGARFDVPQVGAAEAQRLIAEGALVVDVRSRDAYDDRHLPNALSLPLAQLRQGIPEALAQAKAKSIVVYCGDGVRIGPEGTHLLRQAGFTQAVNLESGIGGWANAGLPVINKPGG